MNFRGFLKARREYLNRGIDLPPNNSKYIEGDYGDLYQDEILGHLV